MRASISFLTAAGATFAAAYAIHAFTLWDAAFVVHMGTVDPLARFASATALIGLPLLVGLWVSIGNPFEPPPDA